MDVVSMFFLCRSCLEKRESKLSPCARPGGGSVGHKAWPQLMNSRLWRPHQAAAKKCEVALEQARWDPLLSSLLQDVALT